MGDRYFYNNQGDAMMGVNKYGYGVVDTWDKNGFASEGIDYESQAEVGIMALGAGIMRAGGRGDRFSANERTNHQSNGHAIHHMCCWLCLVLGGVVVQSNIITNPTPCTPEHQLLRLRKKSNTTLIIILLDITQRFKASALQMR